MSDSLASPQDSMQARKKLEFAYIWITALLVGILILHLFIGYAVAPMMFKHFDKKLAGEIMGYIFNLYYPCQLILLMGLAVVKRGTLRDKYSQTEFSKVKAVLRHVMWIIISLIILLAIQIFLQYQMQSIKLQNMEEVQLSIKTSFGVFHGISQFLYLTQAILMLFALYILHKKRK